MTNFVVTASPAALQRRQEWRSGWPVVVSACAGMTLASLPVQTTGIFMASLQAEFGWSRAFISAGLTVNFFVAALLIPFVGRLIDRVGPRRVGIFGVVLFGAAFAGLGINNGSKALWLTSWLLVAIGTAAVKPTVWAAAVASRFQAARGVAIALALTGTPLTAILAPGISNAFLNWLGWRGAYLGVSVLWLAVIVPLMLLFFYGASDLGRKSLTAQVPADGPPPPPVGQPVNGDSSWAVLAMLAVAAGLATLFVAGLIVHVVPLLGEAGLDRQQALILTTILGGGAFVGRLLAGYILDRRDARLFGAVAFLLPALAFAGFAVFDLTMPVATVLVLLFALGSGAELEVASYLTARYFNLANFGARFGMVTFATGLGTGGGPPLAGWIFDRWGTYEPWLVVAPFVFALCSALILCLPSQPNVER